MKNIDHLIKLANRIGAFFEALPDHAEGVEGVANHIEKFWEPRMRVALLDFLKENPSGATENEALKPIALEAITTNAQRLAPKTTTTA